MSCCRAGQVSACLEYAGWVVVKNCTWLKLGTRLSFTGHFSIRLKQRVTRGSGRGEILRLLAQEFTWICVCVLLKCVSQKQHTVAGVLFYQTPQFMMLNSGEAAPSLVSRPTPSRLPSGRADGCLPCLPSWWLRVLSCVLTASPVCLDCLDWRYIFWLEHK